MGFLMSLRCPSDAISSFEEFHDHRVQSHFVVLGDLDDNGASQVG